MCSDKNDTANNNTIVQRQYGTESLRCKIRGGSGIINNEKNNSTLTMKFQLFHIGHSGTVLNLKPSQPIKPKEVTPRKLTLLSKNDV